MRGKGGKNGKDGPPIIIRREEVVEGESHGGAWKIAYADFVTAMMAFFLLMWLLNATTEDQRKGLADYFSPSNLFSHASSGTGEPFGGHTAFDNGALVSDRGSEQVVSGKRPVIEQVEPDDSETLAQPRPNRRDQPTNQPDRQADQQEPSSANAARPRPAPAAPLTTAPGTSPTPSSLASSAGAAPAAPPLAAQPPAQPPAGAGGQTLAAVIPAIPPPPHAGDLPAAVAVPGNRTPTAADIRAEQERREKQAFEQAAQQIRDAVRGDPALAELARQLTIDITPEGLRIQLLDEEHQAMFATGSSLPNDRARLLLQKVAPVLNRLPEQISIAGHTDAAPFPGPGRTNWELSTERANATRRLLTDAGLPDARITRVTGHADRDPLLPTDPLAAANRRIAIVVLRSTSAPPVEGQPTAPTTPASAGAPAKP
jgi:chemotaxis protein MotB